MCGFLVLDDTILQIAVLTSIDERLVLGAFHVTVLLLIGGSRSIALWWSVMEGVARRLKPYCALVPARALNLPRCVGSKCAASQGSQCK